MRLLIAAAAFFVAALAATLVATPVTAQTAGVAGEWELEWETPRGSRLLTFDLSQDGEDVTGTVAMAMPNREVEMDVEGTVRGSAVTLSFEFSPGRGGGRRGGDRPAPVFSFEGTLVDGEVRGTMATPRGDPVEAVLRRKSAD